MPERPDPAPRLTVLLRQSRSGDPAAEEELFRQVFADLHSIARGLMRAERRGHTLQPTALVGEAWLRIAGADLEWVDRAHFFRVAARAMRRALCDHARARGTHKRDAGAQERTPLDDVVDSFEEMPYELLDLDEALERLAEFDAQLAQIVELRFFAGLSLAEIGKIVGTSHQQVHRSWNLARGWLYRRLKGSEPEDTEPKGADAETTPGGGSP
jgi:RNA polymerase sigma factor (TIGR02999 family)